MKSIRLWTLTEEEGQPVARDCESLRQTETEQKLEELLVRCPDLLGEGLSLIGRQNVTDGGPLDLLGIAEDGRLVVFELKRGILSRDAVAQVIDYVSFLNELDGEALSSHIESQSGRGGIAKIEDFRAWYQQNFPGKSQEYSAMPRAVLVGLGVDDRARRMVEFLAANGMDITLATFQAFRSGNDVFLARQVDVEPTARPSASGRTYTKQENQQLLMELARKHDCEELLEEIKNELQAVLQGYIWPNASNYSLNLTETSESGNATYRNYISLYVDAKAKGRVQLICHPRAMAIIGTDLDSIALELSRPRPTDGAHSFQFSLNRAEWERTKSHWLTCAKNLRMAYEARADA